MGGWVNNSAKPWIWDYLKGQKADESSLSHVEYEHIWDTQVVMSRDVRRSKLLAQ